MKSIPIVRALVGVIFRPIIELCEFGVAYGDYNLKAFVD